MMVLNKHDLPSEPYYRVVVGFSYSLNANKDVFSVVF